MLGRMRLRILKPLVPLAQRQSLASRSTSSLFIPIINENMEIPQPPQSRLSDFGLKLAKSMEVTKSLMFTQMNKEDQERQSVFLTTKELRGDITLASLQLDNGDIERAREHLNLAYDKVDALVAMGEIRPPPKRSGTISGILEEMVFIDIYLDFFKTGQLMKRSAFRDCFEDSEYLSGVLMFTNQLSEYSIGRAMNNDIQSVVVCRDMVLAISGCLISFDFRNGPLRRKYDGLKYALKTIEDLLFEQSLLDPSPNATNGHPPAAVAEEGEQSMAKKSRLSKGDELMCLDVNEFDEMKKRYEEYDAAREVIIKSCREGQKLSKLAIYSIHRGQFDQSMKQMSGAAGTVPAMMSHLIKHPALREGGFNNMLEEWCEAKLFYDFVLKNEIVGVDTLLDPVFKQKQEHDRLTDNSVASGGGDGTNSLVDYEYELEDVISVYLGGLVDLTGEIGRLAVAAGTKRDLAKVKQCYEATCVVSTFLSSLPPSPALKKKGGAVATNLRKMGQILYELSLAERGRTRASTLDLSNGGEPSKGDEGEDN